MNDLPEAIERLNARMIALEERVSALEHPAAATTATPRPAIAEQDAASEPLAQAGAFSVLGRAMLGIAGAYLLRAVAESSLLPRPAVAAFAIAYAILWLALAARTPAAAWFAGATYACTSALILAPMLWELTLRFGVLPPAAAAAALALFAGAAAALVFKHPRAAIEWVACLTTVAVAVPLAIASRQMTPFLAVLLLLVLLCEAAASRDRAPGPRLLAAAAADLAIWAQIYIYGSPQAMHGDYPTAGRAALLAPAFTLVLIDAASLALRTIARRKTIAIFEIFQATIAFLLAACALLYFGQPAGAVLLGAACLVLSAGLYAATFLRFVRMPERRNYAVFAAWSVALFLAGSFLALPPAALALCLCAAALAATLAGAHYSRMTLELHGFAALAAAATANGLLDYLGSALAGTLPGAPAARVWTTALCALLCYAVTRSHRDEDWKPKVLHLGFAVLAAGGAAALLVEGLAGLMALGMHPGAHHIAFLRTLVLCALALALAFMGAHRRRAELTWMGYAALALVAVKLLAEDLRQGHLEYVAASICLFALTLIAAPRVTRTSR